MTVAQLHNLINGQLLHNQHRSLFYMREGSVLLGPSTEMTYWLTQRSSELILMLQSLKRQHTYHVFVKDVAAQILSQFVNTNQYLHFHTDHARELTELYDRFFTRIEKLFPKKSMAGATLELLLQQHYGHLRDFLIRTNGSEMFAKYAESEYTFWIPCEEYTPELQANLLGLDIARLQEPVLDVGCGSEARLVTYLRAYGIEAYGTDRLAETDGCITRGDWLATTYEESTWGTIVSHMAFSNHFIHHHLKTDGNIHEYAHKYMELLRAIRPGGSFIYSPCLLFMEELLDARMGYQVEYIESSKGYRATKITRIHS
ncbi:class I SAM-dependent methyltransferase [Paenibacillus polymyxa]|uniref:class I SAM-dependent methyltransferase n=1 Tax=Paenibacillus polymyxa TaxID=1406 RepID=UPI0025B70D51|nr:class I SAM-dependent methyltransferase [Paenibacillus polymyxa]MDN4084762.1 class I SAM-dependent methyltransferase [Paenibacillus polymyxa]MDN4086832.1 class I SAM-dependent methyltransferase [Paenibacillus polymyxa]MDN4108458.1 class I SAM-dependent methyltransferase [Paenibacillus polymyxa]